MVTDRWVSDAQRNLQALDTATRAIAGLADVETVLQLIADTVRVLVEARYAALGVVDGGGHIERFITSGVTVEQRERIGAPPSGHGLLGLLIREGRPYRVPRIADHADSSGFPPHHPPMGSFLGVPVAIGGVPMGNLYLTDKETADEFSEDDQQLVEMFALHAGIAIERARLYAKVGSVAIVDERERIGRDLHDGIIQGLYGIVLSLEDVPDLMAEDRAEAAARVDRAIDRLNLTIREIRDFIFGLGPDSADDPVLVPGLAVLAEGLRMDGVAEVDLLVDDAATVAAAMPVDTRAHLLQMAREALSNVARHAAASHVSIELHVLDGVSTLRISDDGHGFDAGAPPPSGHLGLANLRDRATAIAATLEIESDRASGTRIVIVVPQPVEP